jgi:hypothetical protein
MSWFAARIEKSGLEPGFSLGLTIRAATIRAAA